MRKKDSSQNPSTGIYENNRYLKSIVVNSIIVSDKIKNVTDSVSTNMTSNVSISSGENKDIKWMAIFWTLFHY